MIRKEILISIIFIAVLIIFCNVEKRLYPIKYEEYVYKYSQKYNLNPNFVFAIIKAESNYRKNAISNKNAIGLMQITESTGSWCAKKMKLANFDTDMLFDPEININIGCWYLNSLSKEFDNNIELIIAAYNGGSGKVREWIKLDYYNKEKETFKKIPYKETENYVKRVKNNYENYMRIYTK